MMIDARTLPLNETIETDVCIVGTGPAGMALALEFANKDFRVCMLESGGIERDEEIQDLSRGKTAHRYPDLEVTYNRQIGGTANIWHIQVGKNEMGARFVPYNETDFEYREEIPYSGWPFSRADLDPFYQRAQSICGLGPYNYDPDYWSDAKTPKLPLKGDRLKTVMCQFVRIKTFIQKNREVIQQAKNITTYYYANVLEVETDETASIATGVRVASAPGQEFFVKAKVVILAAGGFEIPRLLLLSNKVQKTGLGNQHDLVGRFFMDHPCYFGGVWYPSRKQMLNTSDLYDLRQVNGTPVMGRLALTSEVVRQEGILNVFGFLHPRQAGYRSPAIQSARTLANSLRRGKLPKNLFKHLGDVLGGFGDLVAVARKRLSKPTADLAAADKGGWSYLPDKDKLFNSFELLLSAEQIPDPNNRITLMEECDRFGRPRVQLHWTWKNDLDLRTIRRAQQIFKEEFEKAGLGRLEIGDPNAEPEMTASSAHHLMGATRMHNDPQQGVVDENCKVHGVSNLFIASSSVFPTGGQVNPTLTIVALSVRLADQVKQVMASNVAMAE
ncbi:GMC family oxidoreductase [Leptolyngbya sp. FACHB-671]|uniref:GMC oxidoreductase n=1 Tax=Leptolyngbya sp. FACHB-671 TaxID=2692812 RepID=UPI00168257CD|nr:GMC family oxidoreductase [Leptolyngbya sp. FACHB-671]MBD2070673.1 GMC family oxidoreductase [Leptolyngbya sp. FACHB-671]